MFRITFTVTVRPVRLVIRPIYQPIPSSMLDTKEVPIVAQIPKRSTQRRRRNKVDITHAPSNYEWEIPEPDEDWHEVATQWYLSLQKSGQKIFFENSDWAQAFYVAEAMSRSLRTSRTSGQLFSAVISAAGELLTTEGARRRMRVELERAHDEGDTTAADAMAAYRQVASVTSIA